MIKTHFGIGKGIGGGFSTGDWSKAGRVRNNDSEEKGEKNPRGRPPTYMFGIWTMTEFGKTKFGKWINKMKK